MTVVAEEEKPLQQVAVEKLELPARDLTTELYELGGVHESFTLDRYNATLKDRISKKGTTFRNIAVASALTATLFSGGPSVVSTLDTAINLLKLTWLVPMPQYLINLLAYRSVLTKDLLIDPEEIRSRKDELEGKKVIYQLVTRGHNVKSLEESLNSVIYWNQQLKEKSGLDLPHEAWILTEEDAFLEHKKTYDRLKREGAKVFVVPPGYSTEKQSKFKSRALHYAVEKRRELGLDNDNVWIYHQDEETMVGEDTVLGISDFILNSKDSGNLNGCGLILYPLNFRNKPTNAQEIVRTADDYRLLLPIKYSGSASFGYHGSHFLTRADVEDGIGWDFGDTLAEDYLFHLKLLERRGNVFGVMKGFGYEKAALSIRDQLKQRRRWILGARELLKQDDISLKHKLSSLYGVISWHFALPGIVAVGASLVHPTDNILPFTTALTGAVWYSMYKLYREGYDLHREYIKNISNEKVGKLRLAANCIAGSLIETVAPWYTLITKPKGFEVIKKDL